MFTWNTSLALGPFGWIVHAEDDTRCRGHRISPVIPLEPPSLACPTPQGRAMVAEEGGPSLWWARASSAVRGNT